MLSTVRKAGLVLDLFVDGQSEWGVTEVAEELEVPKSGAHSILATLTEIGLLERTDEKRYRLGWQLVALSRVLLDNAAIRKAAIPMMYRLASQHEATSCLVVRERGRAMCIERMGSRSTAAAATPKVGEYLPGSHPTARMLLLGRTAEPQQGTDEFVQEAAAAIHVCGHEPVAALSVVLPAARFTASSAAVLVTRAAATVSTRLLDQDPAHHPSSTFLKAERRWPVPAGRD